MAMFNTLEKYKHLDIYVSGIAAIITIIYAIIQVIHTHNTKDVNGISIHSVAVAMLANLLIMIHGCFVNDKLILIISSATLLLNIYRIYQYYCFKCDDKTQSSTNTNASSTSV
jgi:uncharacterized protein with PQ loop repeat